MFGNYLKVALSDLARNWLYAAISIAGLAVSFAGGILVTQFVRNEFSYDRWIPGYERVFKLFHSIEQPGQPVNTSDYLMAGVKKQLAEADPKSVAAAARLMQGFPIIFQNPDPGDGGIVDQSFSWADPEIFQVLPLPAAQGDLETALNEPGSVVMTRAAANKYFGRENVVGETLNIGGPNNSKIPLKVTAILENLPTNTNLVTEIFASGKTAQTPLANMDSRPPVRTGVSTYIFARIAETATQDDLERAIDAATVAEAAAFAEGDIKTEFWAVPLSDLHMTTPQLTGLVTKPTGSSTTAWAIAAVGALIVLVAGINFVTLMTARASRRALEVGVRKANGAKRSDLIVQFMGEALIYAVLSMILAIILAGALAQPFSDFVQRGISVDFIRDPVLAGSLVLATLVIAFLGGLYPALVLSSFRPGAVLKGGAVQHSGSPATRQVLVVVQFSILIGLILATGTIYRQTEFALKQGLGEVSDQIIQVRTNCQNAFPAEVRKLPGVERAACSSLNALSSPAAKNITNIDTKDGRNLTFTVGPVDFEFFETFNISPLAGRLFDRERGNDGPLPLQAAQQGTTVGQQPGQAAPPPQAPPQGAPGGGPPPPQFGPRPVILNEAAAISLGYATPEEAVGKTMSWSQPGAGPAPLPSEIIGVVPDIPVNVGAKADAMFYFIAPRIVQVLSIKTTGEDVAGTVREIQRVWKDTGNVRPIELTFYEQTRRTQYLDIIIQGALIGVCAAAAIAIACLGLFALSALAAERRTKEIGIRKALGATTPNVLGLLMWQFTIPVLWAIAIAAPVSWLLMANWLQGFAYRVDLPLWLFAVAALAALAIAWATVSFQTWRVARAKPMNALRYE